MMSQPEPFLPPPTTSRSPPLRFGLLSRLAHLPGSLTQDKLPCTPRSLSGSLPRRQGGTGEGEGGS